MYTTIEWRTIGPDGVGDFCVMRRMMVLSTGVFLRVAVVAVAQSLLHVPGPPPPLLLLLPHLPHFHLLLAQKPNINMPKSCDNQRAYPEGEPDRVTASTTVSENSPALFRLPFFFSLLRTSLQVKPKAKRKRKILRTPRLP